LVRSLILIELECDKTRRLEHFSASAVPDCELGLFPGLRARDGPLPTNGSSREVGIVSAPGLSPASVPRGPAQVAGAIERGLQGALTSKTVP
jgi:hypothetical protein